MKNFMIFLCFIFFTFCSPEKLEIAKGKAIAEDLIRTIDKEKYSELSKFYTKGFNEGEPIEQRTEKFKALKKAEGELVEFKLTDSINEAKQAEESRLILTYQVKYTNLTTSEAFTIVYDEGEYKVANHSISSINKK